MFVLRREQTIDFGRVSEYDAYQKQSLEAVKHQPGFLRDLTALSLGNHAHRLLYQIWTSKEAFLAYSRGEHWVRPPEGLEPGIGQSGYYEFVAIGEDMPPDQGHFVIERNFRVINGRQDEFEAAEA
ncbi:MAG: hypothetical protein HW403_302, partial [Dehalococcoidia bacterium]|nr:hypothetical protein [Dehalococcoidia bacterium]